LDGALHIVLKSWLGWLWLQLYHCWRGRGTACKVSVYCCERLPLELREKIISWSHRLLMRMLDQAWWRRRGVDALRMLSLVLN